VRCEILRRLKTHASTSITGAVCVVGGNAEVRLSIIAVVVAVLMRGLFVVKAEADPDRYVRRQRRRAHPS